MTQNILILSSNTGGGHRSAANALEYSFSTLDPGRILVKITQVLEEACPYSRRLADLYNYLLREHQDWMKYYFWAVNKLKPNESKLIFKAAMGYGMRVVDKVVPSAVVSVHPMTQHFFSYILRKLHLRERVPFYTVVTDPCDGFWRGWACHDVDHYFVASEEAKSQLLDYGIGSHKISIAGMPVHSRFQPATSEERKALRRMMGLDPEKFTVFLNAGWVGGGNVSKIYEELARADLDIQAVFLAGQNDRLRREALSVAETAGFPVKVMGTTSEIHQLMNISDIMVSKLGGLTTFEALACQLPIIGDCITSPMPQEAQTARFIEKKGTGLLLGEPERIVSVVQSFMHSPGQLHDMRQAALTHARAGAADRIAQGVLTQLDINRIRSGAGNNN